MAEKRIYHAIGSVRLRGVEFRITAETLEEARDKARKGDFDDCDYDGAELYDWEIKPVTIQEDEE